MTENTCCIITSCVIDVITHQIFIHVSMAPMAILLYALYAFSILFEILWNFFWSFFISCSCLLTAWSWAWIQFCICSFFFQAGLVTTLSTRTIVFGATNPKGQYDPDQCITSIDSFNQTKLCQEKKEEYINQLVFTGRLSLFTHLCDLEAEITLITSIVGHCLKRKLHLSFLNLYFSECICYFAFPPHTHTHTSDSIALSLT